jgi:hypothetical protein
MKVSYSLSGNLVFGCHSEAQGDEESLGYRDQKRFFAWLIMTLLARIFYELLSRDHEDGRATGQPQGVGPEAYLVGTSQGPTSEDARKDGHIIRARYATLSPASGFPVSWSQQVIHEIPGLKHQKVKGSTW